MLCGLSDLGELTSKAPSHLVFQWPQPVPPCTMIYHILLNKHLYLRFGEQLVNFIHVPAGGRMPTDTCEPLHLC